MKSSVIEDLVLEEIRKELYRTIIDRIIWTRNDNDVKIDIEYK